MQNQVGRSRRPRCATWMLLACLGANGFTGAAFAVTLNGPHSVWEKIPPSEASNPLPSIGSEAVGGKNSQPHSGPYRLASYAQREDATQSGYYGQREVGSDQEVSTQASQAAEDEEPAGDADAHGDERSAAATSVAQPKDPKAYYGLWTLAPAIVAILLAIFTRQVVPALVVGVLAGAYMLLPCLPAADPYAQAHPVVGGLRLAAEKYVMGPILDPSDGHSKLKIMIFTLVIGYMVGVLGRNGGTAGLVNLVAGGTESRRRGALTAWLAGMVVFFDDYANTMIIGPTMRSVFDKLKLSRAKLAYIVDSTAAPVASLALIGTWVGAEIGYIQQGLDQVTQKGVPAALTTGTGEIVTGMQVFISTLPYRFYAIFAIVLVFLIALTGRDFGPMKRSESLALSDQEEKPYDARIEPLGAEAPEPRWWLGLIPILILIGATIEILILTGQQGVVQKGVVLEGKAFWERAADIISAADAYVSIFYGAILAAFVAMILTMLTRACSVRDAADAGLDGMARMFPAIVILILAWGLSGVEQDLQLNEVVSDRLQAAGFPLVWMPLAIFVAAALVSFATGTSWGTMGILCPVVVTVSASLIAGMEPAQATPLFYAAVGSVLAGAIFGDHCSPISDTTVLSSVASGCRHEEHVWTQFPYALVAAIAAMGLGNVLCSVYDQPWYYGLGAGCVFLLLIVLILGRRPKLIGEAYSDMP